MFYRVAELYVTAKRSESERLTGSGLILEGGPSTVAGMNPIPDIDKYLASIGLAPHASSVAQYDASGSENDQMDFLNDWYMGNTALMGFLEQDMAFISGPNVEAYRG